MIYIVLIRGVNVGGKNKLKMEDLKLALLASGFERVKTYIQSGNVVLKSSDDEASVKMKIESLLLKTFGIATECLVRTYEAFEGIYRYEAFKTTEVQQAILKNTKGESQYILFYNQMPTTIEDGCEDAAGDKYSRRNREVYLLLQQSIRDSKLAVMLQKQGETCTARNLKTVGKIFELAEKMK